MSAGARAQVKAMNKLGWFLTFGTFGQAFAALIVTVSLIARPLPAYQRQTVAFQTGACCPVLAHLACPACQRSHLRALLPMQACSALHAKPR